MKHLGIAALVAAMGVSAPACAADPTQFLFGTQPRYPQISMGICGAVTVDGAIDGTVCAPGFQPATTFINAAGVLTQVSPSTPFPTIGSTASSGGTSTPTSLPPGACSATSVGTTPTKIIDTVASGVPRNGGGFQLSPFASVSVIYSWIAGANLAATTPGAFMLSPGGTIPFAGAPNTALYAIVASGTASVSGGCMTE